MGWLVDPCLLKKMFEGDDFILVFNRVVVRDMEGMFVVMEFDFHAAAMDDFCLSAKLLEHVRDISPVEIHGDGMGEDLFECFLGFVTHAGAPCGFSVRCCLDRLVEWMIRV